MWRGTGILQGRNENEDRFGLARSMGLDDAFFDVVSFRGNARATEARKRIVLFFGKIYILSLGKCADCDCFS